MYMYMSDPGEFDETCSDHIECGDSLECIYDGVESYCLCKGENDMFEVAPSLGRNMVEMCIPDTGMLIFINLDVKTRYGDNSFAYTYLRAF